MVKRWQQLRRVIPLLIMTALVLSGCSLTGQEPGPLDPRGSTGEEQFSLILLSTAIMSFVLVVVFILFFYVMIRFRAKKGDESIPKQVEGNHKLEIVWTTIPIILITILAIPTVAITFSQAEDYAEHPDAILVNVTAHQFWWEFEYPELGIITAQEVVMPVDKKVQFKLTASDVVHSFWVPGLGGKIDTNPGLVNSMYLEGKETGVFKGKCAELCGAGHALMDFKAVVVTQDEFDQWVQNMQQPTVFEVSEDLAEGLELFRDNCMSCHAVDSSMASLGPNLKGFANRQTVGGYLPNEEQNIADWIKDPLEVKPGNKMPAMPLDDAEIMEIVKYLQSLK